MRQVCQTCVRRMKTALRPCQGRRASENAPRARSGRNGALPAGIIRRGVIASMLALPIALPAQQPAQQPAQVNVQPPSPAAALRVWKEIEPWVRQWSVPDEAPDGLPSVHVASITLRLGGVVLATRTMVDDDQDVLVPMVREALDNASQRLPFDKDIFFEQKKKEAAQRLSISLELGGALVPMSEQSDFERELGTNPGLDGVAVRYNEQVEAMCPGEMLARGTTPGSALNIVRGRVVGDDPTLVLQPERMQGATYYRFRTTHLAQENARSEPVFLHRAGRIVPLTSIDQALLETFADDLATFLTRQQWPGMERIGMQGALHATRGRSDPPFAGPMSQAVSAFALSRYSTTPGVNPDTAQTARVFVARILADLSVVEDPEIDPWSTPTDAAMCMIALKAAERADVDLNEEVESLSAMCRQRCWASFSPEAGFDPSLPVSAYGLISYALVRTAATDDERAIAVAAVRATYQVTPLDQLSAQMPWLGWAELELAGQRQVAAGVALRDMRASVWADQFTAADAEPGDEDLVGGIVITSGGMNPLPSWHTARRVAFLATMLGDDRLTEPAERGTELVSLLRSLRFLKQLSVDDAVLHMCRAPMRTIGGIRSSLWDQSMPPDATAFTLLAVTETLRSLEGL